MNNYKKNICWITGDYFLDTDVFVVPKLLDVFNIKWFIIKNKKSVYSHDALLNKVMSSIISNISVIELRYRLRDVRVIIQFVKLLKQVIKENPDIIYIAYSGLPYFMPLVKLMINSKIVIFASHNVTTPKGAVNMVFASKYQKYILKSFCNFHVFSKNQFDYIKNKYPSKNIFYAPMTLKDFGKSNKLPTNDVISFLFFGLIRKYKRLDLLILAACNVFEKTEVSFKVTIAGRCENWKEYQTLIRYPNIFNLMIKDIPDNQIADLFCSNHYLILPYQDGTQSGPLKIAFNYNIPIIASDIDAFREFIIDKKTGYLFKSEDVLDFENVLLEILTTHNDRYSDIKTTQLSYIKKESSNEAIIEKYKQFLSNG